MTATIIAVFDSNVLIPMIIPASRSSRILHRLKGSLFQLFGDLGRAITMLGEVQRRDGRASLDEALRSAEGLRSTLLAQGFQSSHAFSFRIATSPQILAEVERKLTDSHKLRRWLGVSESTIAAFLSELRTVCTLVSGELQLSGIVKRDPDDDKIVAAAKEAGASYIVTEDRDLLDLGEWQGIKIVNREHFERQLDTVTDRVRWAECAADEGDFLSAAEFVSEEMRYRPDSSALYGIRGSMYVEMGEWDQATRDFSEVIERDPSSALAYGWRALAYAAKGDIQNTILDCTEGIRRSHDVTPWVFSLRGFAYCEQASYPAAIADLNQGILLSPQNAANYVARAKAFRAVGEITSAVADERMVTELTVRGSAAAGAPGEDDRRGVSFDSGDKFNVFIKNVLDAVFDTDWP